MKNPNDWEAVFYSAYFKAASCRIMDIASAITIVKNSLPVVLELIDKNEAEENKEASVCTVISQTRTVCWNLFSAAKTHFLNFPVSNSSVTEVIDRAQACSSTVLQIKDSLLPLHSDCIKNSEQVKKDAISAYETSQKMFISLYNGCCEKYPTTVTEEMRSLFQQLIDDTENRIIRPSDATHTRPELKSPPVSGSPVALRRGCYVATAVYGSYDCPQVWTLRRYRDEILAGTWYGRAFIHSYYAISSTLVKWFGSTGWFQRLWRPALDKLVNKLNREGVADTPYQDRNW